MFSFKDRAALLVGAGNGIGRSLAQEFARRGARVVAADIDAEGAAETAQLIRDAGGEAESVACDLTDPASVASAVESAEEFLGAIDVAANTAGLLLSGNPEDIPPEEWERIFGVNLIGATRLNHIVMPKMIERGDGYIVNTASVAGLFPFAANRLPYASSKAALLSMCENLAIYLRPKGVRVSCLCPGPTATAIRGGMRTWSDDVVMRGPGREFLLMSPGKAANIFCDGMEAEKVVILSHPPATLDLMRRFAASPEAFLMERIGQFACGDAGLPAPDLSDPEIAEAMRALSDKRG